MLNTDAQESFWTCVCWSLSHLCWCGALSFSGDVVQIIKLLVTLRYTLSYWTHRLGRVALLNLTPVFVCVCVRERDLFHDPEWKTSRRMSRRLPSHLSHHGDFSRFQIPDLSTFHTVKTITLIYDSHVLNYTYDSLGFSSQQKLLWFCPNMFLE